MCLGAYQLWGPLHTMSKPRQPKFERHDLQLSYKKASILDVPLIFQLIQEGAECGSFADAFVERTGSIKILAFILRSIALQYFQSPRLNVRYEWLVIASADKEVGFMKLTKGIGDCKTRNLELLAICPANRNSGIGTAVLEQVASEVPNGGQLHVHCTKYARAMQHILKRHLLKRNVKFGVPFLEEYRSNLAEQDPNSS